MAVVLVKAARLSATCYRVIKLMENMFKNININTSTCTRKNNLWHYGTRSLQIVLISASAGVYMNILSQIMHGH
jgi:hypothetical protein